MRHPIISFSYFPLSGKIRNASYSQQPDGGFNYPLYYKSKVYKNASPDNSAPIVIDVPEKVNLDGKLSSNDIRYTYYLYVKDSTGTNLLFTSDFVGSSFMPTPQWNFEWTSKFGGTTVAIYGNWE